MSDAILTVEGLSVRYRSRDRVVHALDSASFELHPGKVLALVGESGSGKSTAAMTILRLLPTGGEVLCGRVLFDGHDLMEMEDKDLRTMRGRRIAMIFQDPVAGLNPVLTIGDQVAEIITSHSVLNKKEAKKRAEEILHDVGLADPQRVAKSYPFQLSGGMCQRVMIGIATALNPEIIIADEATSALDVTIQAQILHQLNELRLKRGTSILLITHDLGVVSQMADDVAVMYAGHVVESGDVVQIIKQPLHPYTHALLATIPRLDHHRDHLPAIPGNPPDLAAAAEHCPFIPRCPKVTNLCRNEGPPPLIPTDEPGHYVSCYNPVWRAP